MTDRDAIAMLSALAQDHRIIMFRLLARSGPAGVPSSEIANTLGLPPTSASFHLKELERTGLATARRDGRFIRYAVDIAGMRGLLDYLTEDCCQGQPALCQGNAPIKPSPKTRKRKPSDA